MNKWLCPNCQSPVPSKLFYNLQLVNRCPHCNRELVFQPHVAVAPLLFMLTLVLRNLIMRFENPLIDLMVSLVFAFIFIIIAGVFIIKMGYGTVKLTVNNKGE
jgi:hypothetical protein